MFAATHRTHRALQDPHVIVSVGGQSNAVTTGILGYFAPSLSGFLLPSSGDSSGGYVVGFSGRNLGPATASLTLLLGGFPCVSTVRDGSLPPHPLLRPRARLNRCAGIVVVCVV